MNLRAGAAVAAARISGAVSRRLGRGGTALPGLIAECIAPDLIETLGRQIPRGAIVVTGTNGKTTTSHMLARILERAGLKPLRNASGSNLARGVVATLAPQADYGGRLRAHSQTIGVFETDEAAFAQVVPAVRPRIIAVTNLFRDQLDRYGEVDTVAQVWRTAIEQLAPAGGTAGETPAVTLALNADDPTVASLGDAFAPGMGGRRRSVYFGVDDVRQGHEGSEHAADAKTCPACGRRLEYDVTFYGHVGHYRCAAGHTRPAPDVAVRCIVTRGLEGSDVLLATPRGEVEIRLPLPGLYNVYNAAAAATAAIEAGATLEAIKGGLETFTAAFGRLERIDVSGRTVLLVLAKNPVGMNEALRTVLADGTPKRLLLALNDLDADGRDVSWIWDADFERLAGQVASLVVSGRRADDLAVRLKYAGALDGVPRIEPHPAQALDAALDGVPAGGMLFAVVTYTAMLALRRVLTERGYTHAYWE